MGSDFTFPLGERSNRNCFYPPAEVTALSGPWDDYLTRKERSALGEAIVYWVWFDEPQRDADEDGLFRAGFIHENALTFIA